MPKGAVACSLQDYWRFDHVRQKFRSDDELRSAGLLISHVGTPFHIAHFPNAEASGLAPQIAHSFKNNWSSSETARLQEEVERKLEASSSDRMGVEEHEDGSRHLVGFDGRAQLSGSILQAKWFADRELDIYARNCLLVGPAVWLQSHMGGGSGFLSSLFDGKLHWSGTANGSISFSGSIFCDEASITPHDPECALDLHGCEFFERADFHSANLHSISIAMGVFHSRVSVWRLRVQQNFEAYWARFDDVFRADQAKIGGSFNSIRSTFAERFEADGIVVQGSFEAQDCRFCGSFSLGDDIAPKGAEVRRARLEGKVNFSSSEFHGKCSFKNVELTDDPANFQEAFSGAIFKKRALWSDQCVHAVAAFGGARLEDGIDYPSLVESEEEKVFFEKALEPASQSGDTALLALESGARTLQTAAEIRGDVLRKHRLHKLALMARQRQSRAPFAEKLLAKAYGWCSDYGLSPLRAGRSLLTLFVVSVCFFLLSIGVMAPAAWEGVGLSLGAPVHPTIASVLEFSSGNMFGPIAISTFDAEPFSHLGVGDSFRLRAWLGAWGVLQQVIAVAFWFQLILTIRRRFQIA